MAKQSRGRGRGRDRVDEGFEENVVKINRCASVVKGGRRFSWGALVVLGNKEGLVGVGYGKANEVPPAVEKGIKDAKKNLTRIQLDGTTIPHEIVGEFGSARVLLRPAAEGTGVIAGAAVRAVVEGAGVRDILTKSFGTNNPMNLVKATMNGLTRLRSLQQVAQLRGVELS